MVSTRSGRQPAGPAADTGDTGTTVRSRPKRGAAVRAAIPEEGEMDAQVDQSRADPALSDGLQEQTFSRSSRVVLSPASRASPRASPVARASPAAGGPPLTPAHHLSAVPLPEDDDSGERAEEAARKTASPDVVKRAPVSDQRKAGGRVGSSGMGTSTLGVLARALSSVLVLALLGTAAMHGACSPSMAGARSAMPPATQQLIHTAAASPACGTWNMQVAAFAARPEVRQLRATAQQHLGDAAAALALLHASAEQQLSELRGRAGALTAAARAHVEALIARAKGAPSEPASAPEAPPATPLPPPPFADAWAVVSAAIGEAAAPSIADAWDAAASHAAGAHKALGVLLACGDESTCAGASARMAAATAARCVLSLSGHTFGDNDDGAGRLQANLAALSATCGAPLIVFEGLDVTTPGVVAVLNNALSESGNLQSDGTGVSMASAAFVFPVATGSGGLADAGGYEGFARSAKDVLAQRMIDAHAATAAGVVAGEGKGAADAAAATVLLRALRRRLDVVVPAV
ncbi:hypothetical protein FOA52_016314 [Chlamydomonas sp. UWO 241]|nr:hypothetical protein FOA52_016314 [Chlamydomonas sp. UWO 241]